MAGDAALADLRAAFQQMDTDHDGRVTYAEVRCVCVCVCSGTTGAGRRVLTCTRSSLLACVRLLHSGPPSRALCPPAPCLAAPPQLRQALQDGHFALSRGEVEQLLEQVDTLHRGEVDFAEYAAAMADWRLVRTREGWGGAGGGGCQTVRLGCRAVARL